MDLQHIEKRLDELAKSTKESLDKTDDKLDTLIDLARQMAVFQSKQEQHSEKIDKIEKALLDLKDDFLKEFKKIDHTFETVESSKNAAINRIHGRIDELASDLRTEITASTKEHKDLEDKTDAVDLKVESKVSFVKGAVAVLGFLMVVAQGAGVVIYTGIKEIMAQNASDITQINTKLHENDRQMDQIVNSINMIRDQKK